MDVATVIETLPSMGSSVVLCWSNWIRASASRLVVLELLPQTGGSSDWQTLGGTAVSAEAITRTSSQLSAPKNGICITIVHHLMAVMFRLTVRQVQNVTFPLPVAQYPSRAGEMLSRLSRLGLALPRSVSVLSTRFVSQSKADSANTPTAVTELYEPVNQSGHGEVSPFVKVSAATGLPANRACADGTASWRGCSVYVQLSPVQRQNPDFHGFSTDPVEDERNMKLAFFLGISVVLVIGGTFIHYLPDHGMRKWARREAERLILLREKDGLPLIEENYYDSSKIILPSSNKD
ncbi:hypothetical protein CCH79_00020101 [Gambusia affinis]|uniref:NADH dehydrogenase [ubiquinone] 1 beta subcomplex subunit 11, mitochondrial n=1 Tax=Gambusia affinis TaxID=33528 RepID=A0A315VYA9_GAMAF|nr:hypothetical protein CCH79_00020101 [Gambusia affinis]